MSFVSVMRCKVFLFIILISGLAHAQWWGSNDGRGQVERSSYDPRLISGWACDIRDTEYHPIITMVRKSTNAKVFEGRTTIPREDAVRVACNNSVTNIRGFSFQSSIRKCSLIGAGNPADWDFVHVYVEDKLKTKSEVVGSPINMYFGECMPTVNFDPGVYPPQGTNYPVPVSPKYPPYNVWPDGVPPSNMPVVNPSWPCQNKCPMNSVSASRSIYQSERNLNVLDNISNFDSAASILFIDEALSKYNDLKNYDEAIAEDYLSNMMNILEAQNDSK